MSVEENKALIHRFAETVWNGRNADAIGEFHAPEFVQNGKTFNTQEMIEGWRDELAKSPDLRHTIEDNIAEGDKVAYRWTMRWTNQETGKQEGYRGITFMRISGGKIVEDWYTADAIDE